jgi:hypothetical protein
MPKDFRKQSVKDATGVGVSGKGKATVRKHQGGGTTKGPKRRQGRIEQVTHKQKPATRAVPVR